MHSYITNACVNCNIFGHVPSQSATTNTLPSSWAFTVAFSNGSAASHVGANEEPPFVARTVNGGRGTDPDSGEGTEKGEDEEEKEK
ncbi:unnamed protein product [Hydatigera taeniaeformis]|uniref:Uncharacterized protein n=1 Tax=Hydatigena taeniaeformis TaxID=6205 RepID=A0A0R3WSR3_HYDTA|nr:unnamed protein product [Hydatigera taeniaeformis]